MATPDYSYWDTVELFEVQYAAWLWFDEEPPPGAFQIGGDSMWPGKILAAEGMLHRETGRGNGFFPRGHHVRKAQTEPFAPRSLLREVALKLEVTPPFLFPEERIQPQPPLPSDAQAIELAPAPAQGVSREALLKIIGALAYRLSEKSPRCQKGNGSLNASAIQKEIETALNNLGVALVGTGNSQVSEIFKTDLVREVLNTLKRD